MLGEVEERPSFPSTSHVVLGGAEESVCKSREGKTSASLNRLANSGASAILLGWDLDTCIVKAVFGTDLG